MDSFVKECYDNNKDQLINYTYITHDNIYLLKPGGTIKYFNLNGELKYGGILIKMLDNDMYTTLKFLLKYQKTYYTLYYSKNYIFYEQPKKKKNKKVILTEILKVL